MMLQANHQMIDVVVSVSLTGTCDAGSTCQIVNVTSNEPVNGLGDGDTAPDWQVTGPLTVKLRAERGQKSSGRIYTITRRNALTRRQGIAARRSGSSSCLETRRGSLPLPARSPASASSWPGPAAEPWALTLFYLAGGGAFFTASSQCSLTKPLSTRIMSNQNAG